MLGWGKSADDGSAGRILEAVSGLKGELGKALRDGFLELRRQNGELREELRELRRAVGEAHKDAAEHRRETEALRQELRAAEAARREAAERHTGAEPITKAEPLTKAGTGIGRADRELIARDGAPAAAPAEPGRSGDHGTLLEKAAGISAAELICHRDTWAFIVEQAARNAHFRVPGELSAVGKDGAASVVVSGRSLMAILTALDTVRQQGRAADPGDYALARKFYDRISAVVETVGPVPGGDHPQATGRTDTETPRRAVIVIDDRPARQEGDAG